MGILPTILVVVQEQYEHTSTFCGISTYLNCLRGIIVPVDRYNNRGDYFTLVAVVTKDCHQYSSSDAIVLLINIVILRRLLLNVFLLACTSARGVVIQASPFVFQKCTGCAAMWCEILLLLKSKKKKKKLL